MTDTMTTTGMDAESAALLEAEQEGGGTGYKGPVLTEAKPCKLPGCPGVIEPGAPNRSEFCDEHRGRSPEARKKRRDWMKEHGGESQDKAPQVVVQLGGGKAKTTKGKGAKPATSDEIAAVEQRALWLAQTAAALILIGTKGPHKEADATDIAMGAPRFAAATGELAKHEEWLRSLGAGGEMSERALAWAGLALAATAMATPILVRHEVIKGGLAELFVTMVTNAEQLATTDTAAA